MNPPAPPAYNKPDAPGVWMNFDNSVSLYQVIENNHSFSDAASHAFSLLKEAQEKHPNWPRTFFVDLIGHEGPRSGFDEDFYEFQQEFFFSALAPFLTAFELPLTGGLINPNPQRNDVPDQLVIGASDK